jgi:1-acyl-sn-glycerol-3-phosphate acyltransferase
MEPLSAAVETLLRHPLRRAFDWRITGLEHIPEQGGVILAANHVSMVDPPVVASVADRRHRRVRFMAMAELFRSPVPRALLTGLGHIPVPRQTDAARSSLTAALTVLGRGGCVGIVPEGRLSRDLEPLAGQTGAARLAQWSAAPVVPIGLWGTHRFMAPGHPTRLRGRIPLAVSIGSPLAVADGEDIRAATDRIMAAICSEVARARTGYPPPRPGDEDWWVRAPDTARLRSCRAPAPPAADTGATAPADGRGPADAPIASAEDAGGAPDRSPEPTPEEPAANAGGAEVLEQQLRSIPFFRNLPAAALEAVAEQLQPEHHQRGDVVFRQGDPADTMYLVVSGQVEVLAGAEQVPLAALGPGSVVGELAVLLDEPRSASLRVVADSWLWGLRRSALDVLLGEHPVIGVELSRELGRRLVATNRRLVAPPTTRFTAVFGPGVAELAAAVLARAGSARVGVLELPGAPPTGPLPDGVVNVDAGGLDPARLAGMAGQDVDGIGHLLMVLPASADDALARVALSLAEHIASFRAVPGWATASGPAGVVLRGDGGPESFDRIARWVTGQAVGLALSSGGSKALAHLGVIRVLRQAGVIIDAVAGTSGGAMVAAGLAIGLSDDEMLDHVRELAAALTLRRFDFNLLPRSALFKGVKLHRQLDHWMGSKTFAETDIPCWVVATDVVAGAEVVIDEGPLADGVRASLSIPGAMNPWPVGGRRCIDGAVVNPMPASVLRDAGLRLVIGSNVAGQELSADALSDPHLLQIMGRMLNSMEREMIKAQVPLVDVLIRPKVGPASSFDFSRIEEFIIEGERAARDVLPEIRAALSAAG